MQKLNAFNQDGFKVLCKLEELLCNAKYTFYDYSDVLQLYTDDFNHKCLASSILMLELVVRNQNGGAKKKTLWCSCTLLIQ